MLKTDPFKGVEDPNFRHFLEGVRANLVPHKGREGFYRVLGTVRYVSSVLYPSDDGNLINYITQNQNASLNTFRREGFLQTEKVVVDGREVAIGDEESQLLAASYLYVASTIPGGGREPVTLKRLRKMAELWGKNPETQKIHAFIDKVATEGFDTKAKQGRGVLNNEGSPKIPVEKPEYEEFDRETLEGVILAIKEKFPRWDMLGNELYATSEDLGLPFDVVKAIELVKHFRNWRVFNVRPEEDNFLVTEFLS